MRIKKKRRGYYTVEDHGRYVHIDNIKKPIFSYHVDKKTGDVWQYTYSGYNVLTGESYGYIKNPNLNSQKIERMLINSEKQYRENNSIGKKIKKFFGFN